MRKEWRRKARRRHSKSQSKEKGEIRYKRKHIWKDENQSSKR